MTNAIEQTKREMYEALAILKGRIEINYSIKDMMRGADEFESALEDHLEAMRQDSMDTLGRLAKMTSERDAIQLRLHAVDHAYSEQQKKAGTSGQVCGDRGASAKTDPYTLGYGSIGKCSNPFPINTLERLHWENGASDAMAESFGK